MRARSCINGSHERCRTEPCRCECHNGYALMQDWYAGDEGDGYSMDNRDRNTQVRDDTASVLADHLEPWWRCFHERKMGLTMDVAECRTCEDERAEVGKALANVLYPRLA